MYWTQARTVINTAMTSSSISPQVRHSILSHNAGMLLMSGSKDCLPRELSLDYSSYVIIPDHVAVRLASFQPSEVSISTSRFVDAAYTLPDESTRWPTPCNHRSTQGILYVFLFTAKSFWHPPGRQSVRFRLDHDTGTCLVCYLDRQHSALFHADN
jgi:hypothetical protein